METAFGVDFGTTNTRIAYFDGEKPIMVPVDDSRGRSYSIPSVVGYQDGNPVEFGYDVRRKADVVPISALKWLLDREDPLDVGGHIISPIRVVTDFFQHLKKLVRSSNLREREMNRISLTVPVNYPHRARENLLEACEEAGVEVGNLYQEPVAALYCLAVLNRLSQISAVFDWGGGTLDIATVKIDGNRLQVKSMDGLKTGGGTFDHLIAHTTLSNFKKEYSDILSDEEEFLSHPLKGPALLLMAEQTKIDLSTRDKTSLSQMNFLPGKHLDYDLTRNDFQELINPDVERAVSCLRRAVRETGIPEQLVNPILLSGGSCNIPLVQLRLKQEFGPDKVVTHLPSFRETNEQIPETDVSNATAIGATLLSVFGVRPVFSADIGVRTASKMETRDGFYPVFQEGELLDFSHPRKEEFFLTNAETGVARLMICDRSDPELQPGGRLLRIVPIPIDFTEGSVEITFEVTPHLSLRVFGSGKVGVCRLYETETFVHDLNLSFEMPTEYEHFPEATNSTDTPRVGE